MSREVRVAVTADELVAGDDVARELLAAGRFTHHLELRPGADVDGEVEAWLRSAWDAAA